jgi:hypothetical protein
VTLVAPLTGEASRLSDVPDQPSGMDSAESGELREPRPDDMALQILADQPGVAVFLLLEDIGKIILSALRGG